MAERARETEKIEDTYIFKGPAIAVILAESLRKSAQFRVEERKSGEEPEPKSHNLKQLLMQIYIHTQESFAQSVVDDKQIPHYTFP